MNLLRYYKDNGELVEVKIKDIENWLADQNEKNNLADFIYQRLYHRYIKPFEYRSKKMIKSKSSKKKVNEYSLLYKNGFSVMANCCLLIETIETFYRGWSNSNSKSESAFMKFFTRDKNFREFSTNDLPTIFYKNIRCGILHQGETTRGWRITRDEGKNIVDIATKEINATKFMLRLKQSLVDYKTELQTGDWNDEIWKMARVKLKAIIKISKDDN